MKHSKQILHAHRAGVMALAVAVLAGCWMSPTPGPWNADFLINLLLWAALVAFAEASPIHMPQTGVRLSFTPAFEFAAVVLFGPALAALLAGVSRGVAGATARRNLREVWLTVAHAVTVIGGSGMLYVALGGRVGSEFFAGPAQALPLALACALFLTIEAGLGALAAACARQRAALEAWRRGFKWEVLHGLLLLPFGIVLAVIQVKSGILGAIFLLLVAWYSHRLWTETRRAHLATVRALVSAIDAADPFTRGRSYRISKYTLCIARHLGVPEEQWEQLDYGALLHDIGRTAILHDILLRPRPLDSKEQAVQQTHPTIGYEIVKGVPFLEEAAEIVYAHHEQPDGRGYPRKLAGEQIPLGARIIWWRPPMTR